MTDPRARGGWLLMAASVRLCSDALPVESLVTVEERQFEMLLEMEWDSKEQSS